MCGFVGWVNIQNDLREQKNIIEEMLLTLEKRGPDDSGFCISENVLLGHRRLIVVDPEGGIQPMTKYHGNNKYTLVYNGEIYNTSEVREKLKKRGHLFSSYSDTEVLLAAYMEWEEDCLTHINGIFSFAVWDFGNKRLFMARDHLGVKPLFYTFKNGSLIFASEIKSILKHPLIEPRVDEQGVMEVFGLGPARTLGAGVFKDIQEVPPAHYLKFEQNKHTLREYWKLEAKEHVDDLDTTIYKVRNLLEDAVCRQLVADVPLGTFLSGGLDSSAISVIAANFFEQKNMGNLKTFSLSYEDNRKYFKKSDFQPNSDDDWIETMSKSIKSEHLNMVLDNNALVYTLEDAVRASDLPGMADIDSSLLVFCKSVRDKVTVALSGECADEIFGGYPWFTNEHLINRDTFPWAGDINHRKRILGSNFKHLKLDSYVKERYLETLNKVPILPGESLEKKRMREIFYLNIKWFMITLLNRKDRMSMANSLEVRVPFADYRIVEYVFNIPNEWKLLGGREKGLLRKSLSGMLPKEILERKKSPYPKTHHPKYTELVRDRMKEILDNKSSPILQIVDKKAIEDMMDNKSESFKKPWYGQLMTGPQAIAYLIQVNMWMDSYNVKLV